MSLTFLDLPPEVHWTLAKFISHPDINALHQTCHKLYQTLGPALWANIDIHTEAHHRDLIYREEQGRYGEDTPAAHHLFRDTEAVYNWGPDDFRMNMFFDERAASFVRTFLTISSSPGDRLDQLIHMIRHLCISPSMDHDEHDDAFQQCWNVLPRFQNLEYLQVCGRWRSGDFEPFPFTAFAPGTLTSYPKLETLRLRGYVPKEFVQFACKSPQLANLDLGILDRPVGSNLCYERNNPPRLESPSLNSEDESEDKNLLPGRAFHRQEDNDSDDEPEDFDHEYIAPRPLAALYGTEISQNLSSLRSLWLCRPAECQGGARGDETYFSSVSDESAMQEWIALLQASRKTLEHLTLEHRPVTEEIETDSTAHAEFMYYYAHAESYHRFVKTVLPTLLSDEDWPALKSIRLYGIDIPDDRPGLPKHDIQKPLDPDQTAIGQLRRRFEGSGVDIQAGLGTRMLFGYEYGIARCHNYAPERDDDDGFDDDNYYRI